MISLSNSLQTINLLSIPESSHKTQLNFLRYGHFGRASRKLSRKKGNHTSTIFRYPFQLSRKLWTPHGNTLGQKVSCMTKLSSTSSDLAMSEMVRSGIEVKSRRTNLTAQAIYISMSSRTLTPRRSKTLSSHSFTNLFVRMIMFYGSYWSHTIS